MEPGHALSDDGLAKPVSFDPREGAGVDRYLVLGGGGMVFVAWLLGYLRALAHLGIEQSAEDASDLVAFFGV